MNKKIKVNYIYNILYQMLLVLTPLVTSPYISRVLGAEGIGIYGYSSSIVSYFILFATFGTAAYGQREVSFYQDNRKKRTEIFWNTEFISCLSTIICLAIFLCFAFGQKEIYQKMYICQSFSIVAVACDVTWFFQGMEEFKKIVTRNSLFRIVNVVSVFVFVKNSDDVVLYALILSITNLMGNIMLIPYLRKYVGKPLVNIVEMKKSIPIIVSLFFPTIATTVYSILDRSMLGVIIGIPSESGYYEQALKLIRTALTFVTALGTVMIPRISFIANKGDKKSVCEYMYKSYKYVWFIGVFLACAMIGVSDVLVPWFYGEGYEKVIQLIKIMSLLIIFMGINNVTGMQYLVATKKQGKYTYALVIGIVVNALLNMYLIPLFFSIGAAWASIVSEIVVFAVQLFLVKKELNVKEIIISAKKYSLSGALMLVLLVLLRKCMGVSFVSIVVLGVSALMSYISFLLFLRDEICLNIFVYLKRVNHSLFN